MAEIQLVSGVTAARAAHEVAEAALDADNIIGNMPPALVAPEFAARAGQLSDTRQFLSRSRTIARTSSERRKKVLAAHPLHRSTRV
jgi:hypothetical protein